MNDKNLIKLKNGVFELETNTFHEEQQPGCTRCNKQEMTYDHPDYIAMNEVFTQLFPNPEEQGLVIDFFNR